MRNAFGLGRLSQLALIFAFSSAVLAPKIAAAQFKPPAQVAWDAGKYEEFLKLSIERDQAASTFASAFNVALGYFKVDKLSEALEKIRRTQALPNLSADQLQKLTTLKSDIGAYQQQLNIYRDARVIRTTGKVIMDVGQGKQPDPNCRSFKGNQVCDTPVPLHSAQSLPDSRGSGTRSGRDLDLGPGEQELFMRAFAVKTLEANGYDARPQKPKLVPE